MMQVKRKSDSKSFKSHETIEVKIWQFYLKCRNPGLNSFIILVMVLIFLSTVLIALAFVHYRLPTMPTQGTQLIEK